MSKVFLLAAFAFLTTASHAQKSDRETVEGNGNLVTRDLPVSSFESLKASGVYELKLSQGDKETVKIEADENLQTYFNVRNEGSSSCPLPCTATKPAPEPTETISSTSGALMMPL